MVKKIVVDKMQTAKPAEAPNPQTMHKLTDERYIYENVRCEHNDPEEPIEVLLLSTVEGDTKITCLLCIGANLISSKLWNNGE